MHKYLLFTDVSLNPKSRLGMGAYLLIPKDVLKIEPDSIIKSDIVNQIEVRIFRNTSSTKLEIETVLWALDNFKQNFKVSGNSLKLYSDSQCVCGLMGRKEKLEATNFISKSSGKKLNHAQLYEEFYKLRNELSFDVIKVSGHSPKFTQDAVHRIFSYVDSHVRKLLKEWIFEQ